MEDVLCGPVLDPEAEVAVDEDDAQNEPEESGQVKPTTPAVRTPHLDKRSWSTNLRTYRTETGAQCA